jgi:hypothetical protein
MLAKLLTLAHLLLLTLQKLPRSTDIMIEPGRQESVWAPSKPLLACEECVTIRSEWLSPVECSRGLTDLARTGREHWISSKVHTMNKEHKLVYFTHFT